MHWENSGTPIQEQTLRPWEEVTAEFTNIIMPTLDAPTEQGHQELKRLGELERYHLA